MLKLSALVILASLTPAAAQACDLVMDQGCTVFNQTDHATRRHHSAITEAIDSQARVDRQMQRRQDQMFEDYGSMGPRGDR